LVVAEDLATKSKDTYVANAVEGMLPMQLSETTSSIVEGYEKLEHSLEHGKDLLQRMHELKEQRRLKNIRKKAKSNRFDSSDDGEISDDDDDDDSAIMETFPNDLNDEHGIKDSAAVPPLLFSLVAMNRPRLRSLYCVALSCRPLYCSWRV